MTDVAQWVYVAPAQWTRGRIKNLIASATNGTWGTEPDENGDNVHCIRAADFDRNKRRAKINQAPLRSVDASSFRNHQLKPGDLVLEKSGGGEKQPVGMAVLFEGPGKAVCSNFCARVSPERDVDPRYLTYVFAAAYGQGLTQSAIKQTTGIQNLDAGAFFSASWAYPGLDEQRRIADFLDAETARIDKMLELRHAQEAKLTERSYASVSEILLPEILTQPLGQRPWTWLPDMPHHRPLVRLGYVCRLQSGLTVDGKRDISGDVVTRPYLRVANVQAGSVALDNVSEVTVPREIADRSTLRPGDVLMTEGGDLDKLGRGTVWRGELPGCLHQNHVFALRPEPDRLDGDYLALMTRTLHGRSYFESTGTKTTNLASTNSSKIMSFPIPLPNVALQRELSRQAQGSLDSVGAAIRLLGTQRALLVERREAFITAAVTGQFDVSTASGRNVTDGVPT
ncbi:hypothetical protein ABZV52_09430 [Streptomyces sp. NPDC004735]|uniref:restriction endonuclease subunit S n=1 Tax=Streptomyces sp. NPDC004735 TaxID=3156654 RepID=UPI0033B28190